MIDEMSETQLSAMEVMSSADAWEVTKIYKYTQAGGKGESKLY